MKCLDILNFLYFSIKIVLIILSGMILLIVGLDLVWHIVAVSVDVISVLLLKSLQSSLKQLLQVVHLRVVIII